MPYKNASWSRQDYDYPFVMWLLWGTASGYTTPLGLMGGDDRVCPACTKQAIEHKNRDLVFTYINPWETVDNKVVYY
jgi:hypothetical protein